MRYLDIEDDRVPAIGLGTWQLEGDECRTTVSRAIDLGYRHIDTATMYNNEEQVGQGIADSGINRHELWITTKVWRDDLHHQEVLGSIDKSLERMACDYIDLLLIHWPNDEVPLRETLQAMKEMRSEGRVRHLGVSNFTPSQVREAKELAPVVCNQVECHLFLQQHDMYCLLRELNMLMTAYSPLARGHVDEDDAVERLAAKHGSTPEQIAIAWQLKRDGVMVIPKASSEEHLRQNLAAMDLELDDEDFEAIRGLDRGERIIDPDFAPVWGS